uniref:Putative Fe-S oxidoreductase n=1 Tax=Desulfovibrio sp. U5L TaxID=596152 RepID=I2Q7J3_9BACT
MRYAQNVKNMNEVFNRHYAAANTAEIISLPEEITLTASLRCNYRCRMCYQSDYAQEMNWSVVERIVPLLPFARTLQIFGGEPLLYKRITDLYRLAHENECYITTISNASLLSDAMIQEIIDNQVHCIKCSIDAGTPETYRKIRGGDFFKVMAGIGRLAQKKLECNSPYPLVDFNFLAMRSNCRELTRLIALAAELNVRAVNVFYPSMHREDLAADCVYFDQATSDAMLAKARAVAARLGVGLNLPPLFSESPPPGGDLRAKRDHCRDPWTKALVAVDGTVSLCCAGDSALGNLAHEDFETLWNGPKAQALRRLVNTPKEPAYCRNCRIRQANPRDPALHMPAAVLEACTASDKATPAGAFVRG